MRWVATANMLARAAAGWGAQVTIWEAQPWSSGLLFYTQRKFGEVVEVFESGDYVLNCVDGLLLVTDSDDGNVFVGKQYLDKLPPSTVAGEVAPKATA